VNGKNEYIRNYGTKFTALKEWRLTEQQDSQAGSVTKCHLLVCHKNFVIMKNFPRLKGNANV